MKGIHHENIVQYLGTLIKDNTLNIFMECAYLYALSFR